MKRSLCLLLLILLVLPLFSCARLKDQSPITVGGTPLDAELFRWYLDAAFGDDAATDTESRIEAATRGCIRYVAVNTAFTERSLSLNAAERAQVSETVNALWQIFGSHYEKAGVSKQTLYKVKTSEARREALRRALYDTGGETPVEEETLRSYFSANYVALRWIRTPYTETDVYGNPQPMGEASKQALLSRLSEAAAQVNAGTGLELIYARLSADGGEAPEPHLTAQAIRAGDPAYGTQFLAATEKIGIGHAAVCLLDDAACLVQRLDPLSDPEWYRAARDACLEAVSEPALAGVIDELSAGYTAVRSHAAARECEAAVRAARNQ